MIYGRKPMGTVAYMGGIPAVYEDFCWCWSQMVQYNEEFLCNDKEYIHYDRVKFSDHAPARNMLAKRFLGDWLLMLDTDHVFEPDILHRLLTSMNEADIDVITGIYQFKHPPHSPVIYGSWDGKTSKPIVYWEKDVKLFQIDAAGAGCLLVKRKVFDAVRQAFNKGPFERVEGFSEDHSFFYRLRKLKIKAFCDPRVECNHVIVKPITIEEDFQPYYDELMETHQENLVPVEGFK